MLNTKTLLLLFVPFWVNAQCWNLVWEDEFTGSALDASKWTHQTGGGGWGNNELQYYQSVNTSVSSGVLSITAKEESIGGYSYTSSRIRSKDLGDWTYGRFEASIKLPEGQGIWPAFWMLPTESMYGIWPRSGEIDIMEYLGHDTDRAYGTIHYSNDPNTGTHHFESHSYTLPSGDFTDQFYEFAVEWEPTAIRWYIDDQLYATSTPSTISPNHWPFNRDYHFILNMAVGGNWPGAPDMTTVFPQTLEIDYVRAYQQLDQLAIVGEDQVFPNTSAVGYELPNISGATYVWNVSNATIASGQNTNAITVNWGSIDGQVSCDITTACGSETVVLPVDITPNLISNWSFEEYYLNWNKAANNGASTNFYINTSDASEGSNSAQIIVNSTGINNWDVQMSRNDFSLIAGTDYKLTFSGKYGSGSQAIAMSIIDASTFAVYASTGFTLSSSWTDFTWNFTSSVSSSNLLLTIDMGQNTGTYYLDNFVFGETSLLPVEWLSFNGKALGNNIQLDWTTGTERNNSHFEILRLDGNIWQKIGEVQTKGTAPVEQHYQFIDDRPHSKTNLYRLKQVDFDGRFSFSEIIEVRFNGLEFQVNVFPNPFTNRLTILGGEKIIVYDLRGHILRSSQPQEKEGQIVLELKELPKGIYWLKVIQGKQTMTKRIIKQ